GWQPNCHPATGETATRLFPPRKGLVHPRTSVPCCGQRLAGVEARVPFRTWQPPPRAIASTPDWLSRHTRKRKVSSYGLQQSPFRQMASSGRVVCVGRPICASRKCSTGFRFLQGGAKHESRFLCAGSYAHPSRESWPVRSVLSPHHALGFLPSGERRFEALYSHPSRQRVS